MASDRILISDFAPNCTADLSLEMHRSDTLPVSAGLIALGPTHVERDILFSCCHAWQTQIFSVGGTPCLQTAVCHVQECSPKDPTYVCVDMLREQWKVNGPFKCKTPKPLSKVSAGKGKKLAVKDVIFVLLAVLGAGWI
ncbi:homocitrate synthase [Pyrenophora seminiperda CCB06]|uniref:Homocitrate synthase n=1 Tax=Pyrenophora seminiperda CCB06 TaxID=1302712 RepID=A0A3M7LV73_9PLEO|nr:homocitrate synthase [Pyrenophora seminiperda CCB06]